VSKYVTLAGFDRDISSDRSRFDYTVNVNGFDDGCIQSSFRNVVSVEPLLVIVPMEVISVATTASVGGTMSRLLPVTFEFPYVILNIENIKTFDGTNNALRGAFAVLRYKSGYRGSNGRGYVVLKPVQDGAVRQQMTTLNNLHVSLQRPNGTLYSNALDEYNIVKLEYEAFNRTFFKVILDKYFPYNEFFKGDVVFFRKVSTDHVKLKEFLGRPEGHEIVDVGQANDSNFYNTFYINAGSTLNKAEGRVVLDEDLVSGVQDIGSNVGAAVINASLQMIVSLKITVAELFVPTKE
jgi:hypothetical protein